MQWQSFLAPSRIMPYFEKVLRSGRLHHAYLFCGPAQVGKRTFATLLAQKVNCLEPDSDPTHQCSQCQKITHGNHPDVRFVEPSGAFIKIGQIREIINDANLKPLEGKMKVYVITKADQLKTEAANALLKVLEEPNDKVMFILTTSKPSSLLPTIISRCLIINFSRLVASQISDYLVEFKGLDLEVAAQIALLADGRIGKALDLTVADKNAERSEILELFQHLLTCSSFLAYYGHIDRLLAGSKAEVIERLHLFMGWLRDLLLLQKGIDNTILNSDQLDVFKKIQGRFSQQGITDLIYRINNFCELIPVNLNQNLYWENTFRKLYEAS